MTSVLGLVNYSTLVSLITFLEVYTVKRLEHNLFEKFLGILMIMIAIACGVYMAMGVPEGPEQMEISRLDLSEVNVKGAHIDDRYVNFDGFF